MQEQKTAKVSPLYKDGSCNDVGNYRPISVLPILGKILERVVYDQLYAYFTDNNLLNPCQSGFRPGHSTSTCTALLVNDSLLTKIGQLVLYF